MGLVQPVVEEDTAHDQGRSGRQLDPLIRSQEAGRKECWGVWDPNLLNAVGHSHLTSMNLI